MTTRNTTATPPNTVRTASWEDKVQSTADLLALIPIINVPASCVSGLISLKKRDYLGVALSVVGLIPVEGEFATAMKIAHNAVYAKDAVKVGMKVAKAVKSMTAPQRSLPA